MADFAHSRLASGYMSSETRRSHRSINLCWHSNKTEAKKRYYALSLMYHPVKAKTDEDRKLATIRQQKLNHAWEMLSEVLPVDRTSDLPFPQCCEIDPFKPTASGQDPSIPAARERQKRDRNKRKPRRNHVWETSDETDEDSAEFPEFTQRQAEEADAFWAGLNADLVVDTKRADLLGTLQNALRELIIGSGCLNEMLQGADSVVKEIQCSDGSPILRSSLQAFHQQMTALCTIISRKGFWLPHELEVNDSEREWFARHPKLFDGLPRPLRRLWKPVASLYADYHLIVHASPQAINRAKSAEAVLEKNNCPMGLPKGWWPDDDEFCDDQDDLPEMEDSDDFVKAARDIAACQLLRRLFEERTGLKRLVKNMQGTDYRIYVEYNAYDVY